MRVCTMIPEEADAAIPELLDLLEPLLRCSIDEGDAVVITVESLVNLANLTTCTACLWCSSDLVLASVTGAGCLHVILVASLTELPLDGVLLPGVSLIATFAESVSCCWSVSVP